MTYVSYLDQGSLGGSRRYGVAPSGKERELEDPDLEAAIIEVRSHLIDGKWHPAKVAKDVARRYGIELQRLLDHAGCYRGEGKYVNWVCRPTPDTPDTPF